MKGKGLNRREVLLNGDLLPEAYKCPGKHHVSSNGGLEQSIVLARPSTRKGRYPVLLPAPPPSPRSPSQQRLLHTAILLLSAGCGDTSGASCRARRLHNGGGADDGLL
jgi:hypothetical protein